MLFRRFISALLLMGPSCVLAAQIQRQPPASGPGAASAQGELTVTLTVVASVGIVIDEDGQPRLMVANAADPMNNVSSIKRVVLSPVVPDSEPAKIRRRTRSPGIDK